MRGSRNFRQGGPGLSDKKSSDNDFFFFFFSPQLILQKSNGQFQRNSLFPIETHIKSSTSAFCANIVYAQRKKINNNFNN